MRAVRFVRLFWAHNAAVMDESGVVHIVGRTSLDQEPPLNRDGTLMTTLERLAARIDRTLSLPEGTHTVEFTSNRPRLYRDGGSKEVSPRLSRTQLEMWMEAYVDGIDTALASVVSFKR